MTEPKRTLKQKAYRELKEYLSISGYLWFVLGLLVLYKSVVLSENHIPYVAHGEALLNALALGKVMLISRDLHLAERFRHKPLIYVTLFKSAVFALVLGCFKILEEIAIGLYHHRSVGESISSLGGGTIQGILTLTLLLAVMLIPFFAFTELGRLVGEDKLAEQFFGSPPTAT